MKFKVLVVDDEPNSLVATQLLLESRGFEVETANGGDEAIQRVKGAPYQYAVAVVDYKMDYKDGAATSEELLLLKPDLFVLIHSGVDATEEILLAQNHSMEAGARRWIGKDEAPEVLIAKVTKWYKAYESLHAICPFDGKLGENEQLIASIGLVGRSSSLAEVVRQTQKYRLTQENVLIIGETGVGKERIAKALHAGASEFVPINCASFAGQAELLESTLFGSRKGSFTGAHENRVGVFERVKGGTVFLDEVESLSLVAQSKLLRAIQEKKVFPVGGDREYEVDFRLIAASTPEIEERVKNGTFRSDLFERLNVLVIKIPPLRERIEDIEPLVAYFCRNNEQKYNRKKQFQLRAIRYLEGYQWPRNVRQLENLIKRIFLAIDKEIIGPLDLKHQIEKDGEQVRPLQLRLAQNEREKLLDICHNAASVREAAKRAQMPESTMRRWLQKHGIRLVPNQPNIGA
ncbi:MAG: sigma-54-dependent Fis family transcriptional regulator [Deltaproteobacteria bacterium]|nr:sigma-54-dependent Fis family transcriptional regulator [Deltaproteobacteria bacterium]